MAGFLMVPRKGAVLACETCAAVAHGMLCDKVGAEEAARMVLTLPLDTRGAQVNCHLCDMPVDIEPASGTIH